MHATCIVWRGRERASHVFGGAGLFLWGGVAGLLFLF